MRLTKHFVLLLMLSVVFSGAFADRSENVVKRTKARTQSNQFGGFGVEAHGLYSLPAGDIVNVLSPAIGFGASLTYRDFLVESFDLKLVGEMTTFPLIEKASNTLAATNIKLLGRYNIWPDFMSETIPGCIYVEAGGGVSMQKLSMGAAVFENNDILYQGGLGVELIFFQNFTFTAGASYVLIPQKYLAGATRDGSFINICAGINYEFSGKKGGLSK